MDKPTQDQFRAYQGMFGHFNRKLFRGELPNVVLNFSRHAKSYGFFAPSRWRDARANAPTRQTHEISLNPDHLAVRPAREVASTLAHEMVHLWQHEHGSPPRRAYHDREWSEKMEAIGLMPTDTGEPGGKRVGQHMTHYIIEGGPFDLAFESLPSEYLLPWSSALAIKGKQPKKKKDPSKVKYSCPSCGANVWGKGGLAIACEPCEASFEAA